MAKYRRWASRAIAAHPHREIVFYIESLSIVKYDNSYRNYAPRLAPLSLLPEHDFTAKLEAVLKAKDSGVVASDAGSLDPKLNQPDMLHPNAAGVDIIVQRIPPMVEALVSPKG